MRALIKRNAAPGLVLVENAERPHYGPNDVLVRIEKSAICGTDLHIYEWDPWAAKTIEDLSMPVGHEFFGLVEAVGDEVKGVEPGDPVTGEGHITCGTCRNCRAGRRHLCRNTLGVGIQRPGCFADYLAIPAGNVFRVPGIDPELASIFDPFGNATHTALSFDLVGEDVLITGAGPIGIMAAAIARHVGARHVVVTDVNEYRLNIVRRMQVATAINAKETALPDVMTDLGMNEGFDVGLEMSGNTQAFGDMLANMNHGGRIASLGIFSDHVSIDWSLVIFKGLIVKGVYGREMYETWYKMVSMLESGLEIDSVITHRLPVSAFEEGFAAMREGRAGKVILEW